MQPARRGVIRSASLAARLPLVPGYDALYARGFHPRRGDLVMVFGRSGAGKSSVVTDMLTRMSGTSGLYFSADTDLFTLRMRMLGSLTGELISRIEEEIVDVGEDYYTGVLGSVDVALVGDGNPSIEDIDQEIDAYVEMYDQFPTWLVIDNLVNVRADLDGADGEKEILSQLHRVAHETGITVFVLHHANSSGVKTASQVPRLYDVQNQQHKYPEYILGVAINEEAVPVPEMQVAVVKARRDKGDPDAKNPAVLAAHLDKCQFGAVKRSQEWWQ